MTPDCCVLADSAVTVGGFEWWGNSTTVDLVAASTNALNGALLARRPDHYKNFTIVGILGMALLGGLGGGITRDVLLGDVPAALTNPAYITVALGFGVLGYLLAYSKGQLFREGLFQFMTSFSLPWYAIVGAQKGVGARHTGRGCLLLAVVRPYRRALLRRPLERCHAEAVHPRRVVRRHGAHRRDRLDPRLLGRFEHVGRTRLRVCRSRFTFRVVALYRGLGGAAGEGTRRRRHPRREAAAPRPQAPRQVAAGASRPRPPRRGLGGADVARDVTCSALAPD